MNWTSVVAKINHISVSSIQDILHALDASNHGCNKIMIWQLTLCSQLIAVTHFIVAIAQASKSCMWLNGAELYVVNINLMTTDVHILPQIGFTLGCICIL